MCSKSEDFQAFCIPGALCRTQHLLEEHNSHSTVLTGYFRFLALLLQFPPVFPFLTLVYWTLKGVFQFEFF